MGYRSDVAVVIYGDHRDSEKYALLKTLMNTTFKEVYEEWDKSFEWHDDKHVLKFEVADVKWYDSYPDVIRFTTMLEEIGDIEGLNYEFIRVGEEVDDVVTQEGGACVEYILTVTREIQVDL